MEKNQTVSDVSYHFEGTFRKAIWPVLAIAQLHGVMPIHGISSESLSDLHFKWKSFRTIYAVIATMILLSHTLLLFWKLLTETVSSQISE